jgi:hypothetical protein
MAQGFRNEVVLIYDGSKGDRSSTGVSECSRINTWVSKCRFSNKYVSKGNRGDPGIQ